MKFEWDPKKALSNLRKHKVSFEEASRALSDPMGLQLALTQIILLANLDTLLSAFRNEVGY